MSSSSSCRDLLVEASCSLDVVIFSGTSNSCSSSSLPVYPFEPLRFFPLFLQDHLNQGFQRQKFAHLETQVYSKLFLNKSRDWWGTNLEEEGCSKQSTKIPMDSQPSYDTWLMLEDQIRQPTDVNEPCHETISIVGDWKLDMSYFKLVPAILSHKETTCLEYLYHFWTLHVRLLHNLMFSVGK